MPLPITLLHYSAPPVVGGVESVLGHHARLMMAEGHQVTIIAGRGGPNASGARFVRVPLADSRHPDVLAAKAALDQGHIPDGFDGLINALAASLAAGFGDTRVVIAHNVCSLHKNLALTAALRRVCAAPGAPSLVMWHHDMAWSALRYRDELHTGWPWDLLRQEWREVDPLHVVVSRQRQEELVRLLGVTPDRIAIIPSGLDVEAFLKLEKQTADLVQRLHLLQAAPIFLLPVRITTRKNIELAIRTVAALGQVWPQVTLIVTGPPGPHNPDNHAYFERLQALRLECGLAATASNRGPSVVFLAEMTDSYLPDEVIGDFYRLADALLLPSRDEGFGIPLLEAGFTGLPVFCADIPALRALGGEQAVYFSPDIEPQALARQIRQHLDTNNVYRLRRRLRLEYTWENIYRQKIAPLLGAIT